MNFNNKTVEKQIRNHIISTYNTIKVKSGECRYNYKCQMNTVHEAKKHNHKKLAMCITIENDGFMSIHFINYHNKKFIDNTLGEWSKIHDYYFVKRIESEDMWDINNIFTAFRKELKSKLSWWLRVTNDFQI